MFSVAHYTALASSYVRVIDMPEAGIADVTFQVGDQRYGGLRRVLGMRCTMLERMLLGDFAEGRLDSAPIQLPEFDQLPGAFRQFLYYLHVGSGSLENVDDVVGLYEISKYFGVADLATVCADFIHNVEITHDICVELCSFAVKYEMWDLTERVANYIVEHADSALADAERAAALPPSFLRYLFQSNNIEVSEVTLVRILLFMNKDQQQALLPFIRLPRIPAIDMMKIVVPSGLFDKDSCLAALAFRENPLSVDLPAEARAARERSSRMSVSRYGKRGARGGRASSGHWGKEYLLQLRSADSKAIMAEDMFAEIVEDEI